MLAIFLYAILYLSLSIGGEQMDKIKEIALVIPLFILFYFVLCLVVAVVISLSRFLLTREPFLENLKEWFLTLFLEILNPFNYLF